MQQMEVSRLKSGQMNRVGGALVFFICLLGISNTLLVQARDHKKTAFKPLPLGSIRPTGWLEGQMKIQADGLSGHLDEFWQDVQYSGWTGGSAEGWERLPYWMDGVVPLAYQLNDPGLTAKTKRIIEYILDHQAEDGWLGPEQSAKGDYKNRDPWPVFVMLKVFTQYAEATGDQRIISSIEKFLFCLKKQLSERSLFDWNRMRWQDGLLSVLWLNDRETTPWLLDLGTTLVAQGYDWTGHFRDLPHKTKVTRWEHESHVVNNAMGVKAPAVLYRLKGLDIDRATALESLNVLDRFHGQATGLFSGDECFAGRMPSQGTETCAVMEYLYSLEVLMSILGEASLGDRLEKIAFNALPASMTSDMWARQYVQQSNQVLIKVSEANLYTTNGPRANLFGLETNYGCCTANMHQGWPKFCSNLWMKTETGLAAVAYAPSRVSTEIAGIKVWIDLETGYPFEETLRFKVWTQDPVRFSLMLRIPGWTDSPKLSINGEPEPLSIRNGFQSIERVWGGPSEVRLDLPMAIKIERRFNDAAAISRGPLVYSLRVGEKWVKVAGEAPHADFEVYPTGRWNYALELDEADLSESLLFSSHKLNGNPFDLNTTPVSIRVRGRLIPEWTLEKNAAAPPPLSPVVSEQPLETLTLVPYGAARLRITEFPTLK